MNQECETYILWSPSRQTITATCTRCGPCAPPRPQTDIAGAERDEIEHLWRYIHAAAAGQNQDSCI